MSYECVKCGECRFTGQCGCKEFILTDEDGDEHHLHAMDAESAALKFAEESNECNDYYLMNTSVLVTIGDQEFEISAEPDVHYSAMEV